MKRFILTIFLLLTGSVASAADYAYEGGHYYRNGVAHTRTSYDYGYWVYDNYRCKYIWYADVRYDYAPVKLDVTAVDFEQQLLAIASGRDKVEGKLRLQAQTHQTRLELVDKLGLSGNFRWENFGVGSGYMIRQYPGAYHSGHYGASGNTVYGSAQIGTLQYSDWYGAFDPNIAAQQSAMLAKGAQDLAITSNTGFNALAALFAEGSTKSAQIIAQGISAKMTLDATKAAPQGSSIQQRIEPAPLMMPREEGGAAALSTGKVPFAAAQSCMGCHSGAKPQGSFDVTKWHSYSAKQQRGVITLHLMAEKDELVMPRTEDGKPAPLDPAKIAEFMRHVRKN